LKDSEGGILRLPEGRIAPGIDGVLEIERLCRETGREVIERIIDRLGRSLLLIVRNLLFHPFRILVTLGPGKEGVHGSPLVALDEELGELDFCDHNPEQRPPPQPASNSIYRPPRKTFPPMGNFNCRQGATIIVVAHYWRNLVLTFKHC